MLKHTLVAASLIAGGLFVASAAESANSPGVTDSTITIGQSCALKGPAAGLGKAMNLGLQTWFDQVNDAGGVAGRQIELKAVNDGYEPEKTEVVTKMLIDKVEAFLLIGEVGTPTSKVAVPIAEEAGVPFIAPFTGAEFLRNPHKPWVVNVRASYYQEMEAHAAYLVDELGYERISCFYQNDGYGQAGLSGIELALERRGMTLASTGTYERNTVAVASGLADVRQGDPQAVVMVGAYQPCAAFIRTAKDAGMTDVYFGNLSFVGTLNLMEELGDAAEGCVTTQVVPFPWDTEVPLVKEFHASMKAAKQEEAIGFGTLEGFMGGKLFTMTLDQMEGPITRQGFIDTVQEIGTYDLGGVTLTYGEEDHQGMDEVYMTVFRGGEVQPLK